MKEDNDGDSLITQTLQATIPQSPEKIAGGNQDGGAGSGRLEVRCPSCHAPMEVAVDTPLTDLTCSACGSHFSLFDQCKATRLAPPLSKMGHFDLIERLGIGAFGMVWKARDKELDRTVAIKIPRAGGMIPEEQEKFFREARAVAQLRHPNIVNVHEVGRDGENIYIVSDFVDGATLADCLADQQLTSREAAELCAKIADALHHAHEKGVVHRDLKPANIMIDGDGQPHLMDFGLARPELGEVTMTMDGQVLGTPAYMSPEQAQGEAHTADRRSDVYSLGVILFQLLTAELPFRGNARMLMHQVIHDEPPSPRALNGNIPKDLETITLKCMEKAPAKRYQTAREFSDECGRYLCGLPIHARQISRVARGWRWMRRRPTTAALLAVLFAVALGGPFVALQQAALRNQTSKLLVTNEQSLKEVAKKNDELQSQLVRNLIERAFAHREAGRISDAITLFAGAYATARANDPLRASTRNLAAAWSAGASLRVSLVHDHPVFAVAFSPDSRTVLTGSFNMARLWNVETGKPLGETMDHGLEGVFAVAFSHNGRIVLTGGGDALAPQRRGTMRVILTGSADGTARLWDAATGKSRGESMHHDRIVDAVAFSPDGRTALTGSMGMARLWDVATRKPQGEPMNHPGDTVAVAFSSDGKTVLTGSGNTARLWDIATEKEVGEPMRHRGEVAAVAFSPDGNTVLTGSENTARLWNVVSRKQVGEPMHHDGDVLAVGFSPDSRFVISGSTDKSARLWDAATGKPQGEPMRHDREVNAAVFSPDGRMILTGSSDRTARLWDVAAGKPPHEPMRHGNIVNAVAFSPDGGTVLTVAGDADTARLWDVATGRPLSEPMRHIYSISDGAIVIDAATEKPVEPTSHHYLITVAAFSPDGRTVLTGSADTAQLWDAVTGKTVGERMRHRGAVDAAAFSPSGRMLLTGCAGGTARLWDVPTGKPAGEPMRPGGDVTAVAFSPDGRMVLTATSNGMSRLWDVATGKPAGEPMRLDAGICAVALSLDARMVLTGTFDGISRLWDTATGKPAGGPMRHDAKVCALAFSPDGHMVLTGSWDETARLWDAATCKPLGEPIRHDGPVVAVAFSPDGRTVRTGSSVGTARHWTVPQFPDNPNVIRNWTAVKTGTVLDDQGALRHLSQAEWLKARDDLEKLRGDLELP